MRGASFQKVFALCLALTLAFGAGWQSVAAGESGGPKMIMAAAAPMKASGSCDGCPMQDHPAKLATTTDCAKASCALMCMAQSVVLPTSSTWPVTFPIAFRVAAASLPAGQVRPPEPYPPRYLFLRA